MQEKLLAGFLFISVIIVRYVQSFCRTTLLHSKDSRSLTARAAGNHQTTFNQYPFLHCLEYPDDDFSHILGSISTSLILSSYMWKYIISGYNSLNHQPSRLQLISQLKIEEVIRHKTPIDTVSALFHKLMY